MYIVFAGIALYWCSWELVLSHHSGVLNGDGVVQCKQKRQFSDLAF
jgi:hypothetical protein